MAQPTEMGGPRLLPIWPSCSVYVNHESGSLLSSFSLRLLYPQSPLMSTIGHRCWGLPTQANNERHSGPGHKASHHPRAEDKEIGKAPSSTGFCDRKLENPSPRDKRSPSSFTPKEYQNQDLNWLLPEPGSISPQVHKTMRQSPHPLQ